MSDPNPNGCAGGLLRIALALFAAAISLQLLVNVIRCYWPWIIVTILFAGIITGVIWCWRNRRSGW